MNKELKDLYLDLRKTFWPLLTSKDALTHARQSLELVKKLKKQRADNQEN